MSPKRRDADLPALRTHDPKMVKLLAAAIGAVHDERQEQGQLVAGAGNTDPPYSWPTSHLCADCGAPTTKNERDTAKTAGYRETVCQECRDDAERVTAELETRAQPDGGQRS